MFRAGGFELTPTRKVDAACGRVGVAAVARAEGCIGDAKKGADDMLEVVAHCRGYKRCIVPEDDNGSSELHFVWCCKWRA